MLISVVGLQRNAHKTPKPSKSKKQHKNIDFDAHGWASTKIHKFLEAQPRALKFVFTNIQKLGRRHVVRLRRFDSKT